MQCEQDQLAADIKFIWSASKCWLPVLYS